MSRQGLLDDLAALNARWVDEMVAQGADTDQYGQPVGLTAEQENAYFQEVSDLLEGRRGAQAAEDTLARAELELALAYNRDQRRDARGRWTKGGGAPVAADPAASLRKGAESGIASRRSLAGGDMASVDLVTFNDGTQAVRKMTRRVPTGRSPKDQNDAEELAAQVAKAVGVRAPAVHRVSDAQILMEYEPDDAPANTFPSWRLDNLKATPEGVRMGLLDLLIENPDRHPGNYLVSDDEARITAIDHGFAWDDLEDYYPSPFTGAVEGRSNPFSPADMQAVRPRLEALRGEFERLGHPEWHDRVMELFEHVEQRASGTERLIP